MYNFISGKLVDIYGNNIVLENHGIGYDITVTPSTLFSIQEKDEVQLYTYLQIKEDCFALYGFYSKPERNMFLKLITVSGVGPKLAMSVLSGMSAQNIVDAINNGDAAALGKIKGVGKKTAERIVLELKSSDTVFNFGSTEIPSTAAEEVIDALISLGMSKSDAAAAVNKIQDKNLTAEELLKAVLKG